MFIKALAKAMHVASPHSLQLVRGSSLYTLSVGGLAFLPVYLGSMSSRLFQEAREKRGLCYSIYSSAWGLIDGGMFNVHAATGEEQLDELRRQTISLIDNIESQTEFAPRKTRLCDWCEYKEMCPAQSPRTGAKIGASLPA